MRGIFTGLVVTLGTFAVLGFAIYSGIAAKSWGAAVESLIIGTILLIVLTKVLNTAGRVSMDTWLTSVNDCKYKYAWDGTGIAVNTNTRQVHLASRLNGKLVQKTYSASDLREWSYEIPGKTVQRSGTVIGGGLQGAFHDIAAGAADSIVNTASAINAKEKTGLTLLVRDIDYPRWFVKFESNRNTKDDLLRWMEILSQHINEGA